MQVWNYGRTYVAGIGVGSQVGLEFKWFRHGHAPHGIDMVLSIPGTYLICSVAWARTSFIYDIKFHGQFPGRIVCHHLHSKRAFLGVTLR
jgi:hypothetical protein